MLISAHRAGGCAKNHWNRRCRFENLERRDLLSSVPPTVVDVEVVSTSWSAEFLEYLQTSSLGTNGYSIPVGSSAQSSSLTWTGLDQIMITFSEDVNVDVADLSLSGVNETAYSFDDFHYDPQTHVATWTLDTPLERDRLQLDLDSDGMDPVRDLDGNALDGEWTNNSSTYASGDGSPGGDFEFTMNVLPTDVNHSGTVTYYDYIYVRQLDGKSTNDPGYQAIRDIDGSGTIDSADWEEALERLTEQLPSGSPAGTNNDAPSTAGFDLVELDMGAQDEAVSLLYSFDDAEDGATGITYSIVNIENSALLGESYIDSSTQELVLNAASGLSGRGRVTVRATDSEGLFVETSVTIDVDYQNQAPVINEYGIVYAGGDTWIISGRVVDSDDDVSDFIVDFYGVVETRSAVDEEGWFEFAVILDEAVWGWEYAVTYDPHGAQSNTPFASIGLT